MRALIVVRLSRVTDATTSPATTTLRRGISASADGETRVGIVNLLD